ncbi:programmed cell death 1 ligand 1-like [Clarias gariepinus]|uniref:programmed cell death 1 ligand 1-like n=1 Tax=Clarias gariepinus TaxID=13013 RepID=UPI00234CD7C4|nr:programmed cell death 1 ligand 1-like [Clarias gariepinus]
MDIRTYSLCALMLVINEVSSQSVIVEAAQEDSVILPCSSSRYEKDVFWRYRDTKVVYEIIEGKENFQEQDAEYRGRVKGFPSEFTKGNYSIRLSDVKLSDTGTYSCKIPDSRTVYVELKVKVDSDLSQKISPGNSGIMEKAGSTSSLVILVLLCSFAF